MSILPIELIRYIFYLGRDFLSHKKDPYTEDIKLMKNITQYGVKRALIHLKEFKSIARHYRGYGYWDYLEGYPNTMGGYIWGDTYHLTTCNT